MSPPPAIDYVGWWQALIDARREQVEAAHVRAGRTTTDFWQRRAAQFREFSRRDVGDPFLKRLLADLPRSATAIDVGAGTGRHLVRLARRIRHVTGVEPSPAMRHFLREEIDEAGLTNVDVVEGAWPDIDVPNADAVYSSHVLYPVRDVVAFLRRMDERATRACYLYLRADRAAMDFGLWEDFYREPLTPQPAALDALGVLWQMGIHADLQVVEAAVPYTFASAEEAAERMAQTLALADGDEAGRKRLRRILTRRLVPADGDRLTFPQSGLRSGIVSWRPSGSES